MPKNPQFVILDNNLPILASLIITYRLSVTPRRRQSIFVGYIPKI